MTRRIFGELERENRKSKWSSLNLQMVDSCEIHWLSTSLLLLYRVKFIDYLHLFFCWLSADVCVKSADGVRSCGPEEIHDSSRKWLMCSSIHGDTTTTVVPRLNESVVTMLCCSRAYRVERYLWIPLPPKSIYGIVLWFFSFDLLCIVVQTKLLAYDTIVAPKDLFTIKFALPNVLSG